MQTHIRLSVTFTLFICNAINFLDSWSFLALLIFRITLASNTGARRASIRNVCMLSIVTNGGRSWRTLTVSSRGPCRLIKSNAGCRRSAVVCSLGRRYMRRRVKKTPEVSVSGLWMRLQYLKLKVPKLGREWSHK